jgi:hypothetical protein
VWGGYWRIFHQLSDQISVITDHRFNYEFVDGGLFGGVLGRCGGGEGVQLVVRSSLVCGWCRLEYDIQDTLSNTLTRTN